MWRFKYTANPKYRPDLSRLKETKIPKDEKNRLFRAVRPENVPLGRYAIKLALSDLNTLI